MWAADMSFECDWFKICFINPKFSLDVNAWLYTVAQNLFSIMVWSSMCLLKMYIKIHILYQLHLHLKDVHTEIFWSISVI